MSIESRYFDGGYLADNAGWHKSDAPWKAQNVASILKAHTIEPRTVAEIGCGSGEVLVELRKRMPRVALTGFDISPQAAKFWAAHRIAAGELEFHLGDFHAENRRQFDVLLMLDVFEHVRNPFTFLEKSRAHARHFVFHIPLDLSVSALVRRNALVQVRASVGHIHYYTKDLALATLADSGYEVMDWRYTEAALNAPGRSLRTRLSAWPRRIAYMVNKELGVRLLGGETLLVLAKSAG